jgi:DNA-binding XRE family transcriptional regulator
VSAYLFDTNTLIEYIVLMKPNDLKKIRKELNVRQSDLAETLGVSTRTYLNWEQPEGKREHRKISEDFAEKIRTLADFHKIYSGGVLPKDLIWIQLPLRPDELTELKRRAEISDKVVAQLLREKIFEIFQDPLI